MIIMNMKMFNEFYIYGMNNIKTNLMYIIILILIISCIQ